MMMYCKKCGCKVRPLFMGERPFHEPEPTGLVMCPHCGTLYKRDIKTTVDWPEVQLVEVQNTEGKTNATE